MDLIAFQYWNKDLSVRVEGWMDHKQSRNIYFI